MAGVRFPEPQARPMAFLDCTSVTLDEFKPLVPPFEAAFHARMAAWRMDGKPRSAGRFTVDKNCPLPTPEERKFVSCLQELGRLLATGCGAQALSTNHA